MRPRSIILFERLFLASIAISALAGIWSTLHIDLLLPAGMPPELATVMPFIAGGGLVVSGAIKLLFWFFIARRGANVAKWIFVVLFVIGLFGSVRAILGIGPVSLPIVMRLIAFVQLLLQSTCVWLLFRPDAARWLKGEPPSDLHDVFS